MRIKVTLNFPEKTVFIPNNYKEILGQYFNHSLDLAGFKPEYVFSDLLGKKKILPDGSFWAVDKAAFSIASPNFDLLFFLSKVIFDEEFAALFRSKLNIAPIEFEKVLTEKANEKRFRGYVWSPLILSQKGNVLSYFDNPALFSELLRRDLIDKHIQSYGGYPVDDRLIVIFDEEYLMTKGMSNLIINSITVPGHMAPIQLIGSQELINTALTRGMGHYNTMGYGMVAEKLFQRRYSEHNQTG